jgi:glutathione S-transferase
VGFEYVSVEEAIGREGLRMVVVGGVPSPWGEAAKGLFHLKGLDWVGVRLVHDSDALLQWAGERTGRSRSTAGSRRGRAGARSCCLAERLAPEPRLVPEEPAARDEVLALGEAICGRDGLNFTRRLQLVHAGLNGEPGFNAAPRRTWRRSTATTRRAAPRRAARRAEARRARGAPEGARAAGSDYLVGDALTAADVYLAAAMALFKPLPQEVCEMSRRRAPRSRRSTRRPRRRSIPLLLAHRDMMYARHLALPLKL